MQIRTPTQVTSVSFFLSAAEPNTLPAPPFDSLEIHKLNSGDPSGKLKIREVTHYLTEK